MKVKSLPFALAGDAVTTSGWFEGPPEAPGGLLSEQLPSWDAAVTLSVHARVRVSLERLRLQTGLAAGSELRVCAGWHCEATRTREVCWSEAFALTKPAAEDESEPGLELWPSFKLEGRALARSVQLEQRLVLVRAAAGSARTAARLPGSVLWTVGQRLVLESIHARFPMEWADFGTSVYRDGAAWALDWDPQDLDCSTLGGVKLLLNQRHPTSAPLLRENPPSEAAKLLWDMIEFDIARQLIEGALSNEEFVEDPRHYAEGTLGATVKRMLGLHFPHHSDLRTLRALTERSRTQFETQLQASLNIYGGK